MTVSYTHLDVYKRQAERSIDHTENRIVAHGPANVEGALALVGVEEVAVVVIGIARRWCRHRIGVGMDGEVIPRRQHRCWSTTL